MKNMTIKGSLPLISSSVESRKKS
jgi:hypothetical protein